MAALTARTKLLNASLSRVRACGYEATSVDELCKAAGVTKGAFFHHFKSKEELAVAAVAHWSAVTGALFASAPYHAYEDPLDQLIAYIDFRAALLEGRSIPEATCLLGTMVQETYESNPAIREACLAGIVGHADTIAAIITAAKGAGSQVVLIGVPELSLLAVVAGKTGDSPIYQELGKEEGVPVIADVFSEILSRPELCADKIHPNSQGYKQMASGIYAGLKNIGLAR